MDKSRHYDIKKLYSVIDDPKKPNEVKRLAHKTLRSIRAQLADPKMKDLRYKYIQAVINKDEFSQKVLELRIQKREQDLGRLLEKIGYN